MAFISRSFSTGRSISPLMLPLQERVATLIVCDQGQYGL